MINYTIFIDGENYTYATELAIVRQSTLDSSLDSGVLTLKMISRAEVFKPFTAVTITYNDGDTEQTRGFFVANDNMVAIIGTGLYNHKISLIEETKLLEKYIVDTNTITQPLYHDYLSGQNNVYVTRETYTNGIGWTTSGFFTDKYSSPVQSGDQTILSINDYFNPPVGGTNSLIVYKDGVQIWTTTDSTESHIIDMQINSKYTMFYESQSIIGGVPFVFHEDTFDLYAIKPATQPSDYTITDVVNRLLTLTSSLRYGETPKFTFNSTQADYYATITAPEFSFTKNTLRECLDQVGGYIHSIVRLTDGVVYFDKLGQGNEVTLPTGEVTHIEEQDIEQYCSKIDTNVDNLVNLDDINQGSVTEPYGKDGYQTIRAEIGTYEVNETNALIPTKYPIEKLLKIEFGYTKDGIFVSSPVGDITPYIYESAEYNALSSQEDDYPYSKAYALYYTQGERNIKGLNFTLPNARSDIFSNYAIYNILTRKTNGGYNFPKDYNMVHLNFRITYIPLVNTRVTQSKTYLEDFDKNITSIYNQTSNKVSSIAYGENLKGAVARLGNISKTKTYYLPKIANIPEVGNLIDDNYYIATVSTEEMRDYIKCTVGLSKDFNQLSRYIGIKNNMRMYEVSEKQSVERYVSREDYCVIGDSITSDENYLVNANGIDYLENTFKDSVALNEISAVNLVPYDIEKSEMFTYSVILPVISLGLGNSLLFAYGCEDNFSAGSKSSEPPTLTSGAVYYRLQNYVPYGDTWGRMEYLGISFYDKLYTMDNYSEAYAYGNLLPQCNDTLFDGTVIADTETKPLWIKKDGRENLNMSYQIHFVTNWNSLIIGSGLARYNNLVRSFSGESDSCKLYILPNRINKFENIIDLTGATLLYDYSSGGITVNDNGLKLDNITATTTGKAWAIVKIVDEQPILMLGRNIDISGTITMPYMTFTHEKIID